MLKGLHPISFRGLNPIDPSLSFAYTPEKFRAGVAPCASIPEAASARAGSATQSEFVREMRSFAAGASQNNRVEASGETFSEQAASPPRVSMS